MITRRTLAPDESQKAIDAGGPLQDLQLDATKLAEMSIAVVEDDGEIIAYWVVWYALHLEPLWVREDHRTSPVVIKQIVQQVQEIVIATEMPAAFCVVEDVEAGETVARYADRLGFMRAPGTLYYVVVQAPAPTPEKG
jgi:hypothetical protein